MKVTRKQSQRGQRAQAVLETAIVIPLMLFLIFNYLAVMVQVVAQNKLDSATALAASSTLNANLGQSSTALTYATGSFRMTFPISNTPTWIPTPNVSCSDGGGGYLEGVVAPTRAISCTASTTINFRASPLPLVFFTPTITSTASVLPSPNRACAYVATGNSNTC